MKWYRHRAAQLREEEEAGRRLRACIFDGTMERTTGLDVRSPEMALGNESSICNTRRGNSVPTGAGNKRGKPAGWKMPTWSQCQRHESHCWGLWVTAQHTLPVRGTLLRCSMRSLPYLPVSQKKGKIKTFSMYNFSIFKCWQTHVFNTMLETKTCLQPILLVAQACNSGWERWIPH